jgi:hypothetical protein
VGDMLKGKQWRFLQNLLGNSLFTMAVPLFTLDWKYVKHNLAGFISPL